MLSPRPPLEGEDEGEGGSFELALTLPAERENGREGSSRKGIKVKQDIEDNWRILRLWQFLGLRPKLEA
jgi:hypothetical protein